MTVTAQIIMMGRHFIPPPGRVFPTFKLRTMSHRMSCQAIVEGPLILMQPLRHLHPQAVAFSRSRSHFSPLSISIFVAIVMRVRQAANLRRSQGSRRIAANVETELAQGIDRWQQLALEHCQCLAP